MFRKKNPLNHVLIQFVYYQKREKALSEKWDGFIIC